MHRHTFLIRRVTIKFSCFIFFFLSSSSSIFFLAAFSLLFFHHPFSFLFFLAFLPCFLSLFSSLYSFFPSLEVSLLSLELTALYWLSKLCFMPGVQLITMKHRVREVYFQENAFSSSSSLHVACVCSVANSSVQEILSDSRTTHGSVLHAEAPADTRLLGCFLFTLRGVSWKCCRGSEVALRVSACSYFNYFQLPQTASLGFGLSRERPLCITSYCSILVVFSILRIKQKALH